MSGIGRKIGFKIWGGAVIATIGLGPVAADPCNFLSVAPETIVDQTLFWNSGIGWQPVTNLETLGSASIQTFAFVVMPSSARRGVIVIKSGTIRSPASAVETDSIQLVRRSQLPDRCGMILSPIDKQVSRQSYIEYHDLGLAGRNASEAETIKAFHIEYLNNANKCERTDDSTLDGVLTFDRRSNRSQFSFDQSVVARGQYSQLTSLFVSKTNASSELGSFEGLRVEIAKYQADRDTATCVRFQILPGSHRFLRIVDLDARDFRPPFPRLGERVWEWRDEANR